MRILLSDGSGLTARQVAGRLATTGHDVDVLTPDPLALTRFTRRVRRLHRVPPYGADPLAWLDAALSVWSADRFDVLLPTQEQVAVLAACPDRLAAGRVVTVVPDFAALATVQDKVSAHRTLDRLGLPQPPTVVVPDADGLRRLGRVPGLRQTAHRHRLPRASCAWRTRGGPAAGRRARRRRRVRARRPVVVQVALDGPLVMVQSVFDRGRLVACHANLRVREGAGGGASHKESVDLPDVRDHLEVARRRAGVARRPVDGRHPGRRPSPLHRRQPAARGTGQRPPVGRRPGRPAGRAGTGRRTPVPSHPGCRACGPTRRSWPCSARPAATSEAGGAGRGGGGGPPGRRLPGERRGADSAPGRPPCRVPSAVAVAAMLVHPPSWRFFASNATTNYALSPDGWQALLALPGRPAG